MTDAPPSTPPDPERTGLPPAARKRTAYGFFALAVLLALVCLAVLLPETRYLRYAAEFRELAPPVFCDDRDIDVVFVGSSRMARSVDAFSIVDAYRKRTGRDLTVVDLSKTGPSDVVMDTLLSELLERRRVKLVVAEMQRPRVGWRWNVLEKTGRVMPFQEYYGYAIRAAKGAWFERLWEAIQLRMGFLEGGLGEPWTGCSRQPADVVDPTLARPKREGMQKLADKIEKKGLRPYYANFLEGTTGLQLDVAQNVIELARDRGTKVFFMSLNTFHEEQVSARKREKFSDMFGTELAAWPPSLFKTLRAEYLYSDHSHLDEDGARLAAAWYARKIDAYLSDRTVP